MRPSNGHKAKTGFTFVEVMIAIVLLAIGLLALVVTQAYAAQGRSLDQTHLLAAQKASSALAGIADRACDDFDQSFNETNVVAGDDMTRTVTVDDGWNGSPNLRRVTVEVVYKANHERSSGHAVVARVLRRSRP